MPELPEVEFTRRILRPAMEGARILRVIARRPDLRYPLPPDFTTRLEGQVVRAIERRAKYLLAPLASGEALLMHLGMSGSFRVVVSDAPADAVSPGSRYYYQPGTFERHDHVVFDMSSGRTVIFNDPRRFGFMKLLTATELAEDWTAGSLGPEPLHRAFSAEALARALHRRTIPVKVALLDQRVAAGLGNIYACEALHRAAVSPLRRSSTLADRRGAPNERTRALVTAIKATLRDAIAHRHRPSGPDRFLVYDREGERCPRSTCRGTIRRIVQAGRSTFFCPVCQR